MLSKTAHEFIRERAPAASYSDVPRYERTRSGFSRELWSDMADLGWLGLQIPEEYDGVGLGFFDLCVVLEQSGRELMPEPFISTLLLGTQALLLGGTAAQERRPCFPECRLGGDAARARLRRRRFAGPRDEAKRRVRAHRHENSGARRSRGGPNHRVGDR